MDPARGEVWWGEAPNEKGRPYLVLTRDEAIPVLRTILVAPVTRTVRGIPTEVPLGPEEGLPTQGVATFDNVLTFPKSMLVARIGALSAGRGAEPCEALRAAVDC
ncbi:MAG: type II toxin-antitoxin system PemK/MazF family toxin [Actinobacteria bacterium]|nr:type II toxin-antitoxin system PemK/MazF family toxin [Actinomycetota bacterium]